MPVFPCDKKALCNDPSTPFQNFSAEAPDLPIFLGYSYGYGPSYPPLGSDFVGLGCAVVCESTVSQEDADLCAARDWVDCTATQWPTGVVTQNVFGQPAVLEQPRKVFRSQAQSVTILCPDGLPFVYSVKAGLFAAYSQAQADAQANSWATEQAQNFLVCLSALNPSLVCVNAEYNASIAATGMQLNKAPACWAVVGALPSGITSDLDASPGCVTGSNTLNFSGMPDTPGVYFFIVRAQDNQGDSMSKEYSITVAGITNPDFTDGKVGQVYSQDIFTVGVNNPIFSVESGALPDGLNIVGTSIQGTPTKSGTFNFQLGTTEAGTGVTCIQDCELNVTGDNCTKTPSVFFDTPIVGSQSLAIKPSTQTLFSVDGNIGITASTLSISGSGLALISSLAEGTFDAGFNSADYSAFQNQFVYGCLLDANSHVHLLFFDVSPLALNGDVDLSSVLNDSSSPSSVAVNNTTNLAYVGQINGNNAKSIVSVDLTTKLIAAGGPALAGSAVGLGSIDTKPDGSRVFQAQSVYAFGGFNPFSGAQVGVYTSALAAVATYVLPNPNGKSMAAAVAYNPNSDKLYVVGNDAANPGGSDVVWVLNATTGALLSTIRIGTDNLQNFFGGFTVRQNGFANVRAVYNSTDNQVVFALNSGGGGFANPPTVPLCFICCDSDTLVGTVDLSAYTAPGSGHTASVLFNSTDDRYYIGSQGNTIAVLKF